MQFSTLLSERSSIRRDELLQMAHSIAGIDAAHETRRFQLVEDSPFEIDRTRARILVVDDEPINVEVLVAYLEDEGYSNIISYTDSVSLLMQLETIDFDVVLMDLMMPRVSGLDLLQQIHDSRRLRHIPSIVLTASTDRSTKRKAIDLGAADFLCKPFDPEELLSRVQNALIRKAHLDRIQNDKLDLMQRVEQRTAELVSSQIQLIQCLGRAAEYRDNDTGKHVIRVGRFSAILAEELGLDPVTVQRIEMAATLHDIGKLGVPDTVLLKPGRLTEEEMACIRSHAALGKAIITAQEDNLSDLDGHPTYVSPLLAMAAVIAGSHHERWDGSGYPDKLSGENIPLEGRIVAVADVFDALTTERPYKKAFSIEESVSIIEKGSGTHFDPAVVNAFMNRLPEIRQVCLRYQDQAVPT
jgi:putative two-component system response regulator